MRRTLVCLAACALLAPLAAQEKVPAPTAAPTVSVNPTSSGRGPLSRLFNRRGGEVMVAPSNMTTTSTVTVEGKPMTMEPVYNSRGRVTGYRPVVTPTSTVAKTETKTTENPVKQTSNTETKVTETKTVTTPPVATQPMPERRGGILSRIFRR
jgi:hypothetical protein